MPDIQVYLAGLFYEKEFDPSYPALWDIREAVFPDVTQDQVKNLAYFLRDHWTSRHQRRMAIVAAGDFLFGLSRMLEQFTGPTATGKFRTFRDISLAMEWLEGRETAAPLPVAE